MKTLSKSDQKVLILVRKLINEANPLMNGIWDTKMYNQKKAILKILKS